MARRGALTPELLTGLGIEKLARLVLHETERNPSFKRIVSAAVAAGRGPDAILGVVNRRLAALERARGLIGWEKRKAFVADLVATVATITDELGGADPPAAVDQILRFLATAERVFERVEDSSGQVEDVYGQAADALPLLVPQLSHADKAKLADQLTPLLLVDAHGLIGSAMVGILPVLSEAAVERLDKALQTASEELGPAQDESRGWRSRLHDERLIRARQAVADQRGDVDAFIALERSRSSQRHDTLGVAERLLAAGRPAEALEWVRQSNRPGLRVMTWEDLVDVTGGRDFADRNRGNLEIKILDALGEHDAAQALRWSIFEKTLDPDILRDYLAHLPDFAEFEVLDRAFAYAASFAHRYSALGFFLAWPRLDLAAKLVLDHADTWEGRHYGALAPAADALDEPHPAAATVLYRALIGDILARARSPAYGHAARYLARLDALAERDGTSTSVRPNHAAYRGELKRTHGRKAAFWNLVEGRR